MAKEYRVYYLAVGQGITGIGDTFSAYTDGAGLMWEGESGTFPTDKYPNNRLLTIEDMQRFYLSRLQNKTLLLIDSYLPQWRLNRWRRYYDISTKISSGGTLTPVEQKEYDCFPSPGETQAQCIAYVEAALKWAADVVNEHNRVESQIKAATVPEDVPLIFEQINYPQWIGA
jgi:hypothetical protein